MLSVGIGPVSLSIEHVLLILAFGVALLVGAIAGRKQKTPVAGTLADVFLVALVSARIGFVVRYFEHYQNDWLGMVDIRDGGFDVITGVLVALVFTGYRMWRQSTLRKPLSAALVAGAVTWGTTFGAIALIHQQASGLPDVELAELNGQPASLTAIADGKPLVVNLWATWCPPCIREMPVLETAQQNYTDIRFVFANQGEHGETIRRFLEKQSLNLDHVVRDQTGSFGQVVGSHGLPTTLFYSADGQLLDSHMGELSRATLVEKLERFDPAFLNQTSPASAQ
ncbi:prolipoprotein diacylglyceryl transferase family protein [Marinobacter persicus]|jgi:thiol-disulfide isomerase/thioredoxin|uniref:Thiol-disulfide isomerase/thioredoxin n=1 Tax=Marinobacter persicus TaxID=930118 RepID=A0A2S6G8M1_9GAMM|nr:prolipoprotein diacylglyceryl transferase family protein [Marinobacter persicus]PPK52481.1 thiol-disulfide isomerase/thioredoxin [Marinobacter persicus]PPK55453.1 thiol-disulfide isomerase/thioredoxin [Marinobacter persicus]PPK57926.1 thiol-disulfide isomerase/thioredoxin [Marinobacter persicus]